MSIWSKLKNKIKSVVNNVSSAVKNTTSNIQNWFNTAKKNSGTTTAQSDATTAATTTDLANQTTTPAKATPTAEKTTTPAENKKQATIAVQPAVAPAVQKKEVAPAVEPQVAPAVQPTPAVVAPEANTSQTTTPEAPAPKNEPTPEVATPTESTMSQVNNPEQSTEAPAANDDKFLAWYKSQFGEDYNGNFSKKEGMSDQDYETGNNLYQAYLQKQNLENQFNSANEALDESKAQQRQEASILRDKMAKYLQQQNKNNGLDNLGVSESVGLQADSHYMNNLGQIESDINTKKTDLMNQYMTNKTNVESEAAANEQNILNKYQQYAREDEQKEYDRQQDAYNKQKYEEEQAYKREQDEYQKQQDAYEKQKYEEELAYQKQQDEYNKNKAIQDAAYNEFMSVVESGAFNTAAELEEFYNTYKDNLSPEQQAIAEQQIKFYKNNPDQQEIDNETKEQQKKEDSAEILSGKKYLNYNGQDYQINSGALAQNSSELELLYAVSNALLGTNNPYGESIEDGKSFSYGELYKAYFISQIGEDKYYNGVGRLFYQPMVESLEKEGKQLTYYDGNWYTSTKR